MKSVKMMSTMLGMRVAAATLFLLAASLRMSGADTKAEDVVARHLDSIGAAEVRSAAKTRIVQGKSHYKIVVGGSGELEGTSALVSQGGKAVLMMKFANTDYRGEQFVTDGDKVSIAAATSSHRRSSLGEFVHSQDQIVSEGLIGGVLTTSWALLNLDENKPKLNFDGEKKVDGRPAYQLTYHSKKKDDLTVLLYFDAENYRHVMTTYEIELATGQARFSDAPGASATLSARQKQTRYTIEERFSDFKTTDGITLPTKDAIHFTEELQNGTTNVYEWDLNLEEVSNNQPVDPRNFQVK